MGLFGKLISKLTGGSTTAASVSSPQQDDGVSFTVTITGPVSSTIEVSDEEVAERAREHGHVLSNELLALKTADQWWNEDTHKRRRREGSVKAYAWLLPFVPLEIAKMEQLRAAQEWGPHGSEGVAKELRALIRERRKAKAPHHDLLQALYGICIAADLSKSLAFEGTQPHYMARFVDINEFQPVVIDYGTMGYQCIEALSKTDVKWLVEAFGEPAEHQAFDALWPHIRRNAVVRYCWGELRSSNEALKSLGLPQKTMQEWLSDLVKLNIGYHKEWQVRAAERQTYLDELGTVLDAAWAATNQPFVVADLETTGLNAETDEMLEFAAVQAEPDGVVTGEFSALVRVTGPVPTNITKLTGISQEMVNREGRSLFEAMKAFTAFVGDRPVFFHNAPFDQGFLNKAASQVKVKFPNPVHDTLPMAREAWPSLRTYKLAALAEHAGATAPTHRALADAKAALAVLLAARKVVQG